MTNTQAVTSAAPVVIHVGVTGHRLPGLARAHEALLRDRIRDGLEGVRRAAQAVSGSLPEATAGGPRLRLLSPLAEGADRLVAEEALALGFELYCPLPFARQDYEQDFPTPASRVTYQALLARATAVLELHGSRATTERAQEAYEAVGRLLLQESDILLAVWNGDAPRGRGGTGQIVAEARQQRLPVLWIHAHAPHEVRVLGSREAGREQVLAVDELGRHLASCVSPPGERRSRESTRGWQIRRTPD